MKKYFSIFILVISLLVVTFPVSAQTERMEAKIITLTEDQITVEVTEGSLDGTRFPVALFDTKQIAAQQLKQGDRVIISFIGTPQGQKQAVIIDHVRRTPLFLLFGIFVAIVIAIGRRKGILSFLAMVCSFLIIGRLIVPQIILGNNPVVISLIGAIFIIPSLFYISHGLNWKTTVAVVGTFLALALTGILAVFFVYLTKLTGFAAEEATYIQMIGKEQINIQRLLLAGIIIGAMGVLDDITISQTGIVEKLQKANPKFTRKELFIEAMDIGRDHIASLVNTLVLVYAGASLPLFVLFSSSQFSYSEVINMEIVATEIVRTLVSSIGIIAAVPITTVIATWYLKKDNR